MVGQGDLEVEHNVGRFASDLGRVVVLAGHHELGTFLADLFKDAVVAALQQPVGVAAGLGMGAAVFDHPREFAADIGRRGQGSGAPGGTGILAKEAAAGPRVAGHLTHLFNREQQHIGVAVVAEAAQFLEMAAAGALVPELGPGAAPVVHVAAGQGALEGVPVHPGHHQHGPIKPVLGDGRDQAGVVEAELPEQGRLWGLK